MKDLEKVISQRKTIVFLDLEGTQFSHEMIAIGAVKASLKKDGSILKFHKGYFSYVLAKNKIGKIVTELTGITENDLKENGVPFRKVVQELKTYLGKDFNKTLFFTYGNHDKVILQSSLEHNLDVNSEDARVIIKHVFDFGEFISKYIKDSNGNTYSLENILNLFDVKFEGKKHNPLYDALNLGYLYREFTKESQILNCEYKKVLVKMRHLPEPIHKVIELLNEGKSITPEMFDEEIAKSLK